MNKRLGNNPNRRIADLDCLDAEQKAKLKKAVHYVGSGHHKRNPMNYGLERTNPRPTKSLCDLNQSIPLEQAVRLLQEGVEHGLYSQPGADGFPKYIWSVSESGDVFEAKTDTHGSGKYHGYPLENEDAMREYVKSIWIKRCHQAGQ